MKSALIAKVVATSPSCRIVGRIRIQKIFYLLQNLGLNSGLTFAYHHYGPYSEQLSNALFFSEFLDFSISERIEKTQSGNQYSIFELGENGLSEDVDTGDIDSHELSHLVGILVKPSSVVIELAATIHWLIVKEKCSDWEAEIRVRKAGKATPDNIAKAVALLKDIDLFPSAA